MRIFLTMLAALATLSLTNCGYNAIQTNDEEVKATWSDVVNQYKRRADLIPNLANTVKGITFYQHGETPGLAPRSAASRRHRKC